MHEVRDDDWGESWRLGESPSLEISEATAGDAGSLYRVSGVVRLEDGGVVVADQGSKELRRFDRTGTHLWSTGGAGDGPGKFQALQGLVLRSDSIWVYDPRLQRVSVFAQSGEHGRTFRLDATPDTVYQPDSYRLQGVLQDSLLVLSPFAFASLFQPAPAQYWDSAAILLYGLDGRLLGEVGERAGMEMFGTPRMGTQLPFGAVSSVAVRGGEMVTSRGRPFLIKRFSAPKSPDLVVRSDVPATPVTEAMMQQLIDLDLSRDSSPVYRQRMLEHYEHIDNAHAPSLPLIDALALDADRNIWARRYELPWADGPRQWQVLGPDGLPRASITIPRNFSIHDIGRNSVVGVSTDSLGVETIASYELIKP